MKVMRKHTRTSYHKYPSHSNQSSISHDVVHHPQVPQGSEVAAIEKLQERVGKLTKENAKLKKQLGELECSRTGSKTLPLSWTLTSGNVAGLEAHVHMMSPVSTCMPLKELRSLAAITQQKTGGVHIFISEHDKVALVVADPKVHSKVGGAKGILAEVMQRTGGTTKEGAGAKFAIGELQNPALILDMIVQ